MEIKTERPEIFAEFNEARRQGLSSQMIESKRDSYDSCKQYRYVRGTILAAKAVKINLSPH